MRELALAAAPRRFVASRDGRGGDGCSPALTSAGRAAFNALISSPSSRRWLSIESTMSWVDFILSILRSCPAPSLDSALGAGRFGRVIARVGISIRTV